MAQVIDIGCDTGKCEHAEFPHKIVRHEARTVTTRDPRRPGKTVTATYPAEDMIICLTCGHWPFSGAARGCTCRWDCHDGTMWETVTTTPERSLQ
jgi:hypothetical protein